MPTVPILLVKSAAKHFYLKNCMTCYRGPKHYAQCQVCRALCKSVCEQQLALYKPTFYAAKRALMCLLQGVCAYVYLMAWVGVIAGNHTLIGLYDLPLLVHALYLRGYKVRGLAHPGHWKTPLGPLFQSLGAVKASPMAAYRLLQDAEAVLLFPGGGREVHFFTTPASSSPMSPTPQHGQTVRSRLVLHFLLACQHHASMLICQIEFHLSTTDQA